MNVKEIRPGHSKNSSQESLIEEDAMSGTSIDHQPMQQQQQQAPGRKASFRDYHPDYPHGNPPEVEDDDVIMLPPSAALKDAEKLAFNYINLQKYCDCVMVMQEELPEAEIDSLIDQMLDCSIAELIANNKPQCPRFKREWTSKELVNEMNFRRSWARDVVEFFDWCSRVPVFTQLPESDKIKMFKGQFTQIALFDKCYRTYKDQRAGLLLGNANIFPQDEQMQAKVTSKELVRMFEEILGTLFDDVIYPMAALKLQEAEYVLIKANIFLFDGTYTMNLTDEGKKILDVEREKHRNAMYAKLDALNTEPQAALSFAIAVEQMMTAIEAAANAMDKSMQVLSMFKIDEEPKRLVQECHVDKLQIFMDE